LALSHSPSIITNGLVLCLDAANSKSYPGSGTTWTDLSGNGNNGTLVNGISRYSFSNSTTLTSCTYDIGWATTRNKSTAYYQGNIYTTKLYNRALTASEIQQNFQALKGRFNI